MNGNPVVVVATDGSETSTGAAAFAHDVLPDGADIHLVTVVPPRLDPMETSTGFAGSLLSDEEADRDFAGGVVEGDAALASTARALGPQPYDQQVLIADRPEDAICEAALALDADLIVVGSHGAGLSTLALGSVSKHVVEHAPCRVLIVPVELRPPR
ncbi:MAG: universal stress protein [Ilumatobacteraceae bacterium]